MAKRSFFSQDIYPAPVGVFLSKLKRIDLLVQNAKPIIKYVRVGDDTCNEMEEGHTYIFKAKLFSIIPLGTYSIEIQKITDVSILSKTTFDIAKVWNHYVDVKAVDENHTMCTHQIDIDAGWRTSFIYWVLKIFYRNNNKKLSKTLAEVNR